MLHHRFPTHNPIFLDTRSPYIGSFPQRHQCHIAAVRPARNAYFLAIHIAGCQQKLGRVHLILQIAAAKILVVCLLEIDAKTSGTAHVGRNANKTARGKRRCRRIECIACLIGGAAMRNHHRWIRAVAFQVKRHP